MPSTQKSIMIAACFATCCLPLYAADNPIIGTWSLNAGKSHYSSGPEIKAGTRTYTETPAGIVVSGTYVDATGKEMSPSPVTFKEDGKSHPIAGDDDFDSVVLTKRSRLKTQIRLFKAGKPVGTMTRTVSKDGKTLTLINKLTNAQGGKVDDMEVYERP